MPLTEQQIRQIIRQEMANAEAQGRFTVKSIPHHTHNGVDSLPVFSPTIVYAGFIPYDLTDDSLEYFLPTNWTVTHDPLLGIGQYTITHNLDTTLYSCVVTATQSTNEKVSAVVECFDDTVDVNWFRSTGGAAVDTSFNFVVVQVNNKTPNLVNYSAQNTV